MAKRITKKATAARGAKKAKKPVAKKKAKAPARSTAKRAKAAPKPAKKAAAKKAAAKPAKKATPKPVKKAAAKRAAPAKKPSAPPPSAPEATPPAPSKAAAAAVQSRFVWVDLVTSDLSGAQSFYKSLLGWGTKDVDVAPPMNKYTMFNWNGEEFGGVVPKQAPNAPSMWMPYVWVEDVDQVSRKTESLGGKILMPPMDIPNVGRFSVIADPTGGVVSPMSFLHPPKAPPAQGGLFGPVAWCELLTSDVGRAGAFYQELFGWGRREMQMGPDSTYHMFKSGDRDTGGMAGLMPVLPSSAWVTYFVVDDVDGRHETAKSAGARELVPPADIPNVGRFSWLADPQGAIFGLFKGNM